MTMEMKFCHSCGMPLNDHNHGTNADGTPNEGNKIIYVLLPDYAAHEVVYLAQAIASDEYALK